MRMPNAHAFVAGGAPKRLAEFMRSERDKYARLVKEAGIKIES